MKNELQDLIDLFLKILHLYSVIGRKPKDYGTGDLLFVAEIHTIVMVGNNREINMTELADMMGVTKGAISQTIRKLVSKNFILKSNTTNRKEINLKLSEKGLIVYKGQEAFQKELFTFAGTLYDNAKPEERVLVKRLFLAICDNMQDRVKQL
ncbi:MAG: MarR family transcriptional regulator [Bacteroidetes bacterium]|nr:MAG: MarR family transcriptional regulator [Bacteroidota bacterium]